MPPKILKKIPHFKSIGSQYVQKMVLLICIEIQFVLFLWCQEFDKMISSCYFVFSFFCALSPTALVGTGKSRYQPHAAGKYWHVQDSGTAGQAPDQAGGPSSFQGRGWSQTSADTGSARGNEGPLFQSYQPGQQSQSQWWDWVAILWSCLVLFVVWGIVLILTPVYLLYSVQAAGRNRQPDGASQLYTRSQWRSAL